jgi:hypothetical protein
MRSLRTLIVVISAAAIAASCATSPNAVNGTGGSRYVVTETELESHGDLSAYDVLQQFHPTFLRSRDPQVHTNAPPTPVAVFVNGGGTEGLNALRSIRASTVKEIRFYDRHEANTKFGTAHNGGAIELTRK